MHHPADLSFDQLEVGREWVSEPRVVSPTDFGTYTALTADGDPADGGAADQPARGDRAPGVFGPPGTPVRMKSSSLLEGDGAAPYTRYQ